MMFILAMDVLGSLVSRADQLKLLQPLPLRNIRQRLSVYVDDVVLFASPTRPELDFIKCLLQSFGVASGLRTNMSKSQVLPIACSEDQIDEVQAVLECVKSDFPCRYLGLPLSVTRLKAADLQPLVDRIADRLPSWKAALLQRSGRLILVRAVLTAISLHILIAIDAPRWIIKAIDKIRRGFLWTGRQDVRGGNCPVAWERVMRPLHLGGLGIHNLDTLGQALRMRWLWIQRSEPQAPTAHIEPAVSTKTKALFAACITTRLGDGRSALFWVDKWLHGQAIQHLAPTLMPFIRKRGWGKRTVQSALQNNAWMSDIIGGLPVPAMWELTQLVNVL